MQLRDYQQKLVTDVYEAWNEGATNVLAQLSTGGGKTVIFSTIVAQTKEPSIVIAHRVEIVAHISLTLARHKIRHNIIAQKESIKGIIALHMSEFKRSYYDPQALCNVAGVDTLVRLDEYTPWFKRIQLVVQDEAHHVLKANKWGKAAALFPNARGLYPTATPDRADGNGLGRHADGLIDKLVLGPPMRTLINLGHLSEYHIVVPPNDLDLSEVTTSAGGDFSPPKLSKAVHKSRITGDVVQSYLKFAKGKLGVTFAVDIEAAVQICAEFNAHGVPAEVISSKTPAHLRTQIMRRFEKREILQLVNVDILGEGVDVPAIEVVSMARPTQSYSLYCQQFGRALRPGKPRATIIDHVGNCLRHGLPDDLRRRWTLDRREKRSKTAVKDFIALRSCLNTECLAAYVRTLKKCPECGHYPEPAGRSSPEMVDGDLIELDAKTLARMRGEIIRIDDAPRIPQHLDPIAQLAVAKRHTARQRGQQLLRDEIAAWAGFYKAANRTDSEIYRLFYLSFGIDVASAQVLNVKDAEKLQNEIKKAIDEMVTL